ncbi:nineteen complex-related protein 2-domain-containing protein [Annulohypoxylon truncatum]|uniref:nineteen complex-related protein 2-domain-containing protein n=1 Tax=Annulohypoxylon truncatum TaxID=327061 RepID=UPI002008A5FB|nr:nineteen complex-related protein 2-domain-containing protein [Annulohypoxylon truncatum]KAI1205626.1 nineteen complex-related protein 2-domain-containing protein [Annulohypoxylon truncatum]
MSAFGAKRKARKITVQDDDDDTVPIPTDSLNPPEEPQGPALQPSFKTNRRPFKQSSLRKSINIDKVENNTSTPQKAKDEAEDGEDGGAPLLIRPMGRSGSTKIKKRASSSRLSFGGPGEEASADEDSIVLGEEVSTPKRSTTLAHTAVENSAYKKGIKNLPLGRLPMRSTDTDEDRPRYSKEYLSELQMSTPNTPQDLSKLQPTSDDEMILDPSELEGALVVETTTSQPAPPKPTSILTEAEIQEKKSRRARLAKEGQHRDTEDFISLSDDDNNDGRGPGDSYLTLLSQRREERKGGKEDTRLIAEDEDLGEGFDEFVEDGGLSLGKRAEREARRKKRAEMASLITAAEGGGDSGDDESDASEAERRAAYEAAQTRAGMDGLAEEREQQRRRLGAAAAYRLSTAIPKITPLPDLSVLVAEFKAKVRRKEEEMERLRLRIEEIRAEREGIEKREPEVQRLLNEAGERYRVLMAGGAETAANTNGDGNDSRDGNGVVGAKAEDNVAAAISLLEQARGGIDSPGQRGLESLGTTPVRQRSQMEM